MDKMFTLRQLLDGQENMALGFIDLEKAYDTVPRDMAMATLRWMGVPEAEVRMVKGTYDETKGTLYRPAISEEFRVDVGLRKGRALKTIGRESGGGSKTGLVTKKKKKCTSIGGSLIPDYRAKQESNNNQI